MLDVKQLVALRKEIKLGSLFTNDYENSFNFAPIAVQDFFDGYIEYLQELQEEDEEYGVMQDLSQYDTADNLEAWYDCFEDDPLVYDKAYHYMREWHIPYSNKHWKQLKEKEDDLEV